MELASPQAGRQQARARVVCPQRVGGGVRPGAGAPRSLCESRKAKLRIVVSGPLAGAGTKGVFCGAMHLTLTHAIATVGFPVSPFTSLTDFLPLT